MTQTRNIIIAITAIIAITNIHQTQALTGENFTHHYALEGNLSDNNRTGAIDLLAHSSSGYTTAKFGQGHAGDGTRLAYNNGIAFPSFNQTAIGYTISLWVNFSTYANASYYAPFYAMSNNHTNPNQRRQVIIAKQNNGNYRLSHVLDCNPTLTLNSTTTPVANTVYNVIARYNGSNMRIYVNGVLEGDINRTCTGYSNSGGATNQELAIGGYWNNGSVGGQYSGWTDSVYLYNYAVNDANCALTATCGGDIAALYGSTQEPTYPAGGGGGGGPTSFGFYNVTATDTWGNTIANYTITIDNGTTYYNGVMVELVNGTNNLTLTAGAYNNAQTTINVTVPTNGTANITNVQFRFPLQFSHAYLFRSNNPWGDVNNTLPLSASGIVNITNRTPYIMMASTPQNYSSFLYNNSPALSGTEMNQSFTISMKWSTAESVNAVQTWGLSNAVGHSTTGGKIFVASKDDDTSLNYGLISGTWGATEYEQGKGGPISANRTYHVVLRYNSSNKNLRTYVDGTLVSDTNTTNGFPYGSEPQNGFSLFAFAHNVSITGESISNKLWGNISSVYIYKTALNDGGCNNGSQCTGDINDLLMSPYEYDGPIAATLSNILLNYDFNTTQSNATYTPDSGPRNFTPVIFQAAPQTDGTYYFDGSNDNIEIAPSGGIDLTGSSYTLAVRFRLNQTSGCNVDGDVTNQGYWLRLYVRNGCDTSFIFKNSTGGDAQGFDGIDYANGLTDGGWYTAILEYNSSTNRILYYLNGLLSANISMIGAGSDTSRIRIGGNGSAGTYFKGWIDWITLYNGTITEAEKERITNKIQHTNETYTISRRINATVNWTGGSTTHGSFLSNFTAFNATGNASTGNVTYNQQMYQEAGLNSVRIDFYLENVINASSGGLDYTDTQLSQALESIQYCWNNGNPICTITGVVAYTPTFYANVTSDCTSNTNRCSINNTTGFTTNLVVPLAAYVTQSGAYNSIVCFEMWNEPDLATFWLPGATNRDTNTTITDLWLSTFYNPTYDALKAANNSYCIKAPGGYSDANSAAAYLMLNRTVANMSATGRIPNRASFHDYWSEGQGDPYKNIILPDYNTMKGVYANYSIYIPIDLDEINVYTARVQVNKTKLAESVLAHSIIGWLSEHPNEILNIYQWSEETDYLDSSSFPEWAFNFNMINQPVQSGGATRYAYNVSQKAFTIYRKNSTWYNITQTGKFNSSRIHNYKAANGTVAITISNAQAAQNFIINWPSYMTVNSYTALNGTTYTTPYVETYGVQTFIANYNSTIYLNSFTPASNPTIQNNTNQTFTYNVNNAADVPLRYTWYRNGTNITNCYAQTTCTQAGTLGNGVYNITSTIQSDYTNNLSITWTLTITGVAAPAAPAVTYDEDPLTMCSTGALLLSLVGIALTAGLIRAGFKTKKTSYMIAAAGTIVVTVIIYFVMNSVAVAVCS